MFNFDDESQDIFHIVYGEAIVSLPDHLHHFVVTGCTQKVAKEQEGVPLRRPPSHCNIPVGGFAGWAPGALLWDMPVDSGVAIGKGVGIVAINVNVHFTDADLKPGAVSRDGIRLHYTPTLRPRVANSNPLLYIGSKKHMLIPANAPRWFVTRRCKVTGLAGGGDTANAPVTAVGTFYHAHLLGREMYMTLERAGDPDGAVVDLRSQRIWHYDDQSMFWLDGEHGLGGIEVRVGDTLQTTCVYDSRGRDKATTFHLETVDEMCINLLMTMHDRAHADAAAADANAGASTSLVRGGWAAITCEGNAYTGELAEGEDAKRLHALHPEASAAHVWAVGKRGGAIGRQTKPSPDDAGKTCVPAACMQDGIADADCCGPTERTECASGYAKRDSVARRQRRLQSTADCLSAEAQTCVAECGKCAVCVSNPRDPVCLTCGACSKCLSFIACAPAAGGAGAVDVAAGAGAGAVCDANDGVETCCVQEAGGGPDFGACIGMFMACGALRDATPQCTPQCRAALCSESGETCMGRWMDDAAQAGARALCGCPATEKKKCGAKRCPAGKRAEKDADAAAGMHCWKSAAAFATGDPAQILPGMSGMWPNAANAAACKATGGGYEQVYSCDGLKGFLRALDNDAGGYCAGVQDHFIERCCEAEKRPDKPKGKFLGEGVGGAPGGGKKKDKKDSTTTVVLVASGVVAFVGLALAAAGYRNNRRRAAAGTKLAEAQPVDGVVLGGGAGVPVAMAVELPAKAVVVGNQEEEDQQGAPTTLLARV